MQIVFTDLLRYIMKRSAPLNRYGGHFIVLQGRAKGMKEEKHGNCFNERSNI